MSPKTAAGADRRWGRHGFHCWFVVLPNIRGYFRIQAGCMASARVGGFSRAAAAMLIRRSARRTSCASTDRWMIRATGSGNNIVAVARVRAMPTCLFCIATDFLCLEHLSSWRTDPHEFHCLPCFGPAPISTTPHDAPHTRPPRAVLCSGMFLPNEAQASTSANVTSRFSTSDRRPASSTAITSTSSSIGTLSCPVRT